LSNQSSNLFFIDLVTSIIIRRNSFIFGRIFSSPSNILAGATMALEEFMRCSSLDQLASELTAAPPVMIQHAWKPTLNDHIKVNCDAAISSKKAGGTLWGPAAWYDFRGLKHVWLKQWLLFGRLSFAKMLVSLR